MEQRFNHANETETLQVQFYSARQSPTESTDEWADRLSSLTDKAFRDVPEHYVQSQIITKNFTGTYRQSCRKGRIHAEA